MSDLKTIIILVMVGFIISTPLVSQEKVKIQPGSLSPEFVEKVQQSFSPTPTEQRLVDAVINNPIKEIAINQQVVQNHNTLFSHKIKTGRVTDQKGTGRCWLYAALNVLRPAVVQKLKMKNFEFSQNYLYFWDKMEKANVFLENVIDRIDEDIRDPKMRRILRNPIEDGGYWQTAVNLIKKYGVVPQNVMPETNSTGSSRAMLRNINEKLRLAAQTLREMRGKKADLKKLRQEKERQLTDIFRMLVFHLGMPPVEFSYRYESKAPQAGEMAAVLAKIIQEKGVTDFQETDAFKALDQEKVSVVKKYTPHTFAKAFVMDQLDDFVMLANWPAREIGKVYDVALSKNVLEGIPLTFLNVTVEDMKMACLQSVLNDDPVDFSADVSHGMGRKNGIMHADLYRYEDIYGVKIRGPKRLETVLGNVTSQHAMVLMGVDIVNDEVVKWRVENSWGTDNGDAGFYYMYDNWFDDYVVRVVIKKKYLPQRLLKLLEQKPEVIPEEEPEM